MYMCQRKFAGIGGSGVSRAAFTLIELLVVVAIIAVLVAILIPSLMKARQSARSAICMSNQRQLGVAWSAYTNDYGVFPIPTTATRLEYTWGGIDWYAPTDTTTAALVFDGARPVNPYVSPNDAIEYRANLFKCPLDIGCHNWVNGVRTWEQVGVTSTSGEIGTCFGVAGNSYHSNTWIYCKPGAINGWMPPGGVNYRSNHGPHHVQITPSRFVLLMDIGPANWIVSTVAHRVQNNLWGEWWHGPEKEMMCYLDGSVRLEKTGLVVCDRYSMHMIPVKPSDANAGWIWPDHR